MIGAAGDCLTPPPHPHHTPTTALHRTARLSTNMRRSAMSDCVSFTTSCSRSGMPAGSSSRQGGGACTVSVGKENRRLARYTPHPHPRETPVSPHHSPTHHHHHPPPTTTHTHTTRTLPGDGRGGHDGDEGARVLVLPVQRHVEALLVQLQRHLCGCAMWVRGGAAEGAGGRRRHECAAQRCARIRASCTQPQDS